MLGTTANAVKKRLQRGRMLKKESLEGDRKKKKKTEAGTGLY